MSSRWRRFETLLPLQFNDGREVPSEWLADAVLEIVDHFGGVSYETQKVEGHWRSSGILYRDNLVKADRRCSGLGRKPRLDEAVQSSMEGKAPTD